MKIHQVMQFLAVACAIAFSAAYFTATQLNASLPQGSPWRNVVWSLSLAVWAFPLLRLSMRGKDLGLLEPVGFYMLGLGATLFAMLLVLNFARLLLQPFGHTFVSWAPLAMGGLSLGMSLLGLRTALALPEINALQVRHKGLHPGLEGLKIAQISDLHLGATTHPDEIRALVEKLMAEKPDLIAVTGDLVDGPRHLLQEALAPLAGLKAPLGVHYVTGNHEYFWGAEAWIGDFKRIGFEVLENAHRVVSRKGARLLVTGVNDPTA